MKISNDKGVNICLFAKIRESHIVETYPTSPIIKISRAKNKDDFYVSIVGAGSDRKISLHESGVTRLAEMSKEPRLPFFRGELGSEIYWKFSTVLRIMFVQFNDYVIVRKVKTEKICGDFVKSKISEGIRMFCFGYLPKDSINYLGFTNSSLNTHMKVFETSRRRQSYAVLTRSIWKIENVCKISESLCIDEGKFHSFYIHNMGDDGYDVIYEYVSKENTYTYLCVCNVKKGVSLEKIKNMSIVNYMGLSAVEIENFRE